MNIYYNLDKIYVTEYIFFVRNTEKNIWNYTQKKYISYDELKHCPENEHFTFQKIIRNKRKAIKEFDKLTKDGVDCRLTEQKIILNKKYIRRKWESKKQTYFGKDEKVIIIRNKRSKYVDKI